MVKPPPKNHNKFQTWFLVTGIAVIAGLNLMMTSLLTKQSLAEMPVEPSYKLIQPVLNQGLALADVDESAVSWVTDEPRIRTRKRAIRKTDEPRYIGRALPPAERFVAPSKPLFEPRIIRIPKPAPPVTFSEPSRTFLARIEYKQQPMSARVVTRRHDSFLAKMIRKPWHFIKAVASKLN